MRTFLDNFNCAWQREYGVLAQTQRELAEDGTCVGPNNRPNQALKIEITSILPASSNHVKTYQTKACTYH
jgi:hypothetical protein